MGKCPCMSRGCLPGANPVAHKVIAEGDNKLEALQGGSALRLGRASLNNAGQVVFIAHLGPGALDFQAILLLATPKAITLADADADSVPDTEDACPDTVWPEAPTGALWPYHYMLMNFDRRFDSHRPAGARRLPA